MKKIFLALLTVAYSVDGAFAQEQPMYFGTTIGDKMSLYGNYLGHPQMYGLGIESYTFYFRSDRNYRWYIENNADGGVSDTMQLTSSDLSVNTRLTLGASDPYLKVNSNDKHLVLSGGSGWTSTGSVILLTGVDKPGWGSAMQFFTGGGLAMHMTPERNIGIGTSTPNYKLDVNGTIRAKEIIVETNWADYVFEDGYELRSLDSVASFISENRRLPGLPSAEEVAETGVSVGQSQRLLLEKIEELTLYLIEKEEQMKEIRETNSKLVNLSERLRARVEALEARVE